MTNPQTLNFTTFFDGWTPANEVFPIFLDKAPVLVGGFLVIEGPVWKCFVAKHGHPNSLSVCLGNFWLTPEVNTDGSITKLILSELAINNLSKKINIGDVV